MSTRACVAGSVVLLTLGLAFRPAPSSAQALTGAITGTVIDERQQPVARAQVQAFSVRTVSIVQPNGTVPFSKRSQGRASTDANGRFQITGLELGDYLVAAEIPGSLNAGARRAPVYATTFYPSTFDDLTAVPVSVVSYESSPIRIEMARVEGVRVSGSVVSRSGRPITGVNVRLARRFGDFGSETTAVVVGTDGSFETARVPPGWYRLIVQRQPAVPDGNPGEFASMVIDVRDRDLDGLAFTLGPGASVTGRVVDESGAGVRSPVGMRIGASLTDDYYPSMFVAAAVSPDWTFRMPGLNGPYQFSARVDRQPFLEATRIRVDGVEINPADAVELTEGSHEVVVFLALRQPPAPLVEKTLSTAALVEQFIREPLFGRQLAIGQEIITRRDQSVLPPLVPLLKHHDRHIRGNAAFVFSGLGDPRGLQVITGILADFADRPEGQGTPNGFSVRQQIVADRYYAVHLLGELRDPQAIPILVPLLKDGEVDYKVPWALGQINDRSAIGPLLDLLDGASATMRVHVIYALESLNAREAVPRLLPLLADQRRSSFGAQVSVAEAAAGALTVLR